MEGGAEGGGTREYKQSQRTAPALLLRVQAGPVDINPGYGGARQGTYRLILTGVAKPQRGQ